MSTSRTTHLKSPRVFLTYSYGDLVFARGIRNLLWTNLGIRVFMDEDLSAGGDWPQKLRSEIEAADMAIAILSPDTLDSNRMLQELGAAWALQKPIFGVVTRRDVLNRLPIRMANLIDFKPDDLEKPQKTQGLIQEVERALSAAQHN